MDSQELLAKAYRLINLYNTKAKKPYTYSDGMTLYPAQSHMIEIIGENEGVTLTEIAAEYLITKGAVSQIVTFLTEKGLVIKKPLEEGGRKTGLYLSTEGRRILDEHRQRHREMIDAVTRLSAQLSPETLTVLSQIADVIEDNIMAL